MYSKFDNCLEHPLNILCRCTEYQEIVNKLKFYSIGSRHYLLPKMNQETIASAKVLWIKNRLKLGEDISKPVIDYSQEKSNINAYNVDKIWIPILSDLITLKSVKLKI